MPRYNCETCMYYSNLKGNYERHLKTRKHNINSHKPIITMVTNTDEHKMNTDEHKMNTDEHKMNTDLAKNCSKWHKICENSVNFNKKSTETFDKKAEIQKFIEEENKFVCDTCFQSFKTHPSMRRHILHYCGERSDKEDMAREIRKLNKEKNKLYKQIDELIQKVGDTTNNIQNNIILNNYGEENISHITDKIKDTLLKIPYGAIPKMIKSIHFNDKIPENKNIKLPNKNDSLVKVYKNNKWIYKDKNETILDLMNNNYFIIDTHYDNVVNNLSNIIKSRYSSFKEYYDEEDTNVMKSLKKDCFLVLLNNRDK